MVWVVGRAVDPVDGLAVELGVAAAECRGGGGDVVVRGVEGGDGRRRDGGIRVDRQSGEAWVDPSALRPAREEVGGEAGVPGAETLQCAEGEVVREDAKEGGAAAALAAAGDGAKDVVRPVAEGGGAGGGCGDGDGGAAEPDVTEAAK